MADDDHGAAGGMTTIASRVASICAMIDEHDAAGTTMSARRVAVISAMINEVAAAAEGVSFEGRRKRKRHMGSARWYEEMHRLGAGTYGVVVKACHRATGQTVAMKALHKQEGRTPGSDVGELLREACYMAACRGHPSIVRLHRVARKPGTTDYFLVMDYVGPTLHRVLWDRGDRPFPEADVRCIMRQLLTGAEAMHKHGIIHRDIKPENILVDNKGAGNVVKIGDYGTALSMAERETTLYWFAGTMWYSAPELLLEMPDYDTLADVWSLGCVMAELLTGNVLFAGEDETDQLYKIFDLLGVPGKRAWKAFRSSPLADEVPVPQWRRAQQLQSRRHSRLREVFPVELLSKDGFEVLKGLLMCDPSKRLTAAAALRLPWFADGDGAPVAAVSKVSAPAIKQWSIVLVLIGALTMLWQMALSLAGRTLGLVRPKALLK